MRITEEHKAIKITVELQTMSLNCAGAVCVLLIRGLQIQFLIFGGYCVQRYRMSMRIPVALFVERWEVSTLSSRGEKDLTTCKFNYVIVFNYYNSK